MKINEAFGPGKFGLSFELFPPRTPESEALMWGHLESLSAYRPSFVTCTYGAGGSTQNKTLEVITEVRRRYQVSVASHLTCVGATVDQLRDYLREADARGVENIVALRGDPPQGQTTFKPAPGGLRYANELTALIRSEFPQFGVAVAGYPEKHLEAPSLDVDLENLKRKVDAGADAVVTQLFYDNDDFFRFRDRCSAAGIHVPIVPGVLPITNFSQIKRITALCGAKLPPSLTAAFEAQGDDSVGQFEVGVHAAIDQVRGLIESEIPGIHFYVLNKSDAACQILDALQLVPRG